MRKRSNGGESQGGVGGQWRGGVEVAWDSEKGEGRGGKSVSEPMSPPQTNHPFRISTLLYLNHSSLIEFVAQLWVCPL